MVWLISPPALLPARRHVLPVRSQPQRRLSRPRIARPGSAAQSREAVPEQGPQHSPCDDIRRVVHAQHAARQCDQSRNRKGDRRKTPVDHGGKRSKRKRARSMAAGKRAAPGTMNPCGMTAGENLARSRPGNDCLDGSADDAHHGLTGYHPRRRPAGPRREPERDNREQSPTVADDGKRPQYPDEESGGAAKRKKRRLVDSLKGVEIVQRPLKASTSTRATCVAFALSSDVTNSSLRPSDNTGPRESAS
jgi:hypothetical protein